MEVLKMNGGMAFTPLVLLIGIVVALVVGFVGGSVLAGQNEAGMQGGSVGAGGDLTLSDKNFIVNVANLQMAQITDATARQSVLLDWCTAGGGQWFPLTQNSAVNVTPEQAAQLRAQGATAQQLSDGNFVAE